MSLRCSPVKSVRPVSPALGRNAAPTISSSASSSSFVLEFSNAQFPLGRGWRVAARRNAGFQTCCVATAKSAARRHSFDLRVWKPAIGSLAPARSALRALPSLRSGNPFRRFPSGSSQQTWQSALHRRRKTIDVPEGRVATQGFLRHSPRQDPFRINT